MTEKYKILITILILSTIVNILLLLFSYLYYKFHYSEIQGKRLYYDNYYKFINDSDDIRFGIVIYTIMNLLYSIIILFSKLGESIYNSL